MSHTPSAGRSLGLTLIELLLVLTVMGLVMALALPALRDPAQSGLREDALRLATLLEGARAASRAYDETMTWQVRESGFGFGGQAVRFMPTHWLHADTEAQVLGSASLVLGPEPVIAAQTVRLHHRQRPELSLWVHTDGVRPFEVLLTPPQSGLGPGP
jgi:general secretion pathway protein H